MLSADCIMKQRKMVVENSPFLWDTSICPSAVNVSSFYLKQYVQSWSGYLENFICILDINYLIIILCCNTMAKLCARGYWEFIRGWFWFYQWQFADDKYSWPIWRTRNYLISQLRLVDVRLIITCHLVSQSFVRVILYSMNVTPRTPRELS